MTGDHTKRHHASCADVQTRSLVVSTMRPANHGALHGTTRQEDGATQTNWELDMAGMDAAARTAPKKKEPKTSYMTGDCPPPK
jgi:hypothetical protein